ncbi:MAG TPA: cation transporter [Gemmatimonadales bacterium]|nr:cation transporter [Gemmatimonadales bacterium]
MTPLTLSITGMSCGHCLNAVNQALGKLEGVKLGSVKMGRAELEYDESKLTPAAVTAAVSAVGYQASVIA